MHISFEALEAMHGDRAREIWNKVCEIGGFGVVLPGHSGGLDCSGLSADKQKEIAALTAKTKEKN